MGTTASSPSPLAPVFRRMSSWDLKAARRLLQDYKDKDLDFGLDAQALSDLISGDKQWAESIVDAFGSTNGIVNALAFICGVCLLSAGPALEKASLVFDAMDFDSTEQISMDEMTIVFLCCCRGLCVMGCVGTVPSDEALETITLQAYRDYSKSSAQSISKAEFVDWVIKFASGAHSGEAVSAKEVSLQAAMEQFGVVSAESQHDSQKDSRAYDENNHQVYEDDIATDATAIRHNDGLFVQDGAIEGASGDYAVEAEHFEPAEQHQETAEQFEAAEQHDDTTEHFDPAEQRGERAEHHEDYRQQDEENGSSGQAQAEDSSGDDYYDEEYDAAVEDAGGSAEYRDLPSEYDEYDPPIENDSKADPELVVAAETEDVSDNPALSSLDDVQGEDAYPPVGSDAASSAPSRPLSAVPTEMNADSSGEALYQDSEGADSFESDTAVLPAKDAPIVVEGEPSATDQPVLLDNSALESHSHEDAYDEEFAHEESAEEEVQPARHEEDDTGEYSVDEHQEETTGAIAESAKSPAEDAGASEAVPLAGNREGQDVEEAAIYESATEASIEPPKPEPTDTTDPVTVADSHEQEDAEAVPEAAPEDNEEACEQDETNNDGGATEEKTPRDANVDVNAFDTYDYEDAAYDASSGLAPPDPMFEVEGESEAPAPLEPDQAAESLSTPTPNESAS